MLVSNSIINFRVNHLNPFNIDLYTKLYIKPSKMIVIKQQLLYNFLYKYQYYLN